MLCPAICDPLNAEVRLYQRILNFVNFVRIYATSFLWACIQPGIFSLLLFLLLLFLLLLLLLLFTFHLSLLYFFLFIHSTIFSPIVFFYANIFIIFFLLLLLRRLKRTTNYEKNIFRYSVSLMYKEYYIFSAQEWVSEWVSQQGEKKNQINSK